MALAIAGGVLTLIVVLMAALYFMQGRLIFMPLRDLVATPEDIGRAFEDVRLEVDRGESIHLWWIPAENADSSRKAIIFCHGNAGNISHRLHTVSYFNDLGLSVLLFDYRGFGESDGSPGEHSAYADVRACYKWLRETKGMSPDDIVVFGRSLGGAIAVDLATVVPLSGLWIESSFTSSTDMGRRMFPFLPIGWLVKYRFDSIDKIGNVSCPVVVAHSPDDEMIPFDMGRRLYDQASADKRFIRLSGGHNDREYMYEPGYGDAWKWLLGWDRAPAGDD